MCQGTRAHVYRWLETSAARKHADEKDLKSLPEIKTKEAWTKKIQPGKFAAEGASERPLQSRDLSLIIYCRRCVIVRPHTRTGRP